MSASKRLARRSGTCAAIVVAWSVLAVLLGGPVASLPAWWAMVVLTAAAWAQLGMALCTLAKETRP